MLRATATVLVMLLFAAVSANAPVFSQDKPPDFIERVDPGDFEQVIPGDSERVDPGDFERPQAPPADPNAPAKLCFWKDPSVSGFGKSGFCEVPSQSAVGAPCRCYSGSGRPVLKGEGSVILAPKSDQPTSVVR